MRRLGWFLVGAAGATGALVAAPSLYGRLRAAIGADDPWNELQFEPEPEPEWGVREAPSVVRETEPPADEPAAEPEPADEAGPEAAVEQPVVQEPQAAEPEPEAAESPEPDAHETSVWSRPARVAADAPTEEAAPAQAEPGEEASDDDTAEIPPAPLTPAPPPVDTAASDLRARIEESRARLHRKAQAGATGDDEPPDEPGEPDSSA